MPKLETRKEQLLAFVVREYSRTAEPVASDVLRDKYGMDISPATIRSEMAALEKAGYLKQPHTSAGRVPTEEGYRYYIENCVEATNIENDLRGLKHILQGEEGYHEAKMKRLAKELAGQLSEGVFISFAPQATYYTGLSYLFDQPEFENVDLVRQIGDIVDNLDQVIAGMFTALTPGMRVYVGSENPFGVGCSTILFKPSEQALLGVLGPMRMDYDKAIGLMRGLERLMVNN